MRWWAGGWVVAGVLVLAACGAATGGGSGDGPSGGRSARSPGPSSGAPTRASGAPSSAAPASPAGHGPATSAVPPSASPGTCAAGRTKVGVTPGDAPGRHLCVRPGTVLSLVLAPRDDDKRWTGARSSAPVFVLVSGWKVAADGTARASVRCAGTRGGTADVTVSAKAPDVAGAPRVAFTLRVTVVPYTTRG
ncbi:MULTISPECIES: hypothetical protein [unclassified Streptomyces]|uniref:hypothetical protein n=1 Tax=unclassified Streptomyces TaxID=2593676 RepID=UPI002E2686B9